MNRNSIVFSSLAVGMAVFASLCLRNCLAGDEQSLNATVMMAEDAAGIAETLSPPAVSMNIEDVASESGAPDPESKRERDNLNKRCDELHKHLASLYVMVNEMSPIKQPGKIQELEKKAFEHDVLSVELQRQDKTIAALELELDAARERNCDLEERLDELKASTNMLSVALQESGEQQLSLKKALSLVRLGQFEYYEIRQGDTCESIALQDVIYGDESKNALIRQANRGNVEDLDRLTVGETLIIPRISSSTGYDF